MPVSNKRFKRASNDHNFGIPWQETDWEDLGRERIKNTLEKAVDTKKAKNVILFIGDGMGLQTVAASRVFKAQKKGLKRQHMYLRWETLPHSSLARVSPCFFACSLLSFSLVLFHFFLFFCFLKYFSLFYVCFFFSGCFCLFLLLPAY